MEGTNGLAATLATRRFVQIPGPNPIVSRGGPGSWDEGYIEGGDIFRDYTEGRETYYLYYHGVPQDAQKWPRLAYRVGVATATHPMGPFTKPTDSPLLDLGPEGSWEDRHVACPSIIKEGTGKYYMWYSGMSKATQNGAWGIGLATASHPLGPWVKYEGNPIIEDFGYVGGVVKVKGKYYMYNEYPIGATGPDYGPFAVATADSPEGPWVKWEGNPFLAPDGWGAWDDGGYSEAKVVYHEGVFHCFYGAAKLHADRRRTLESIGYAFSLDGYHFTKHLHNPVAARERNPDASCFAEVKALIEPPFVYLYHTLRYLSLPPGPEDLGVQVLAMSSPFRLTMPALNVPELAAGASTTLDRCPPLAVGNATSLALNVRCHHHARARAGVRVHVRASDDGLRYDTADWCAFDNAFTAGQTDSRTVEVSSATQFVKVFVENLDAREAVTDVELSLTLGG